jgi:hypothetical protein
MISISRSAWIGPTILPAIGACVTELEIGALLPPIGGLALAHRIARAHILNEGE